MGQGQFNHSTLQYGGASSPHLLSESSRLEREIGDNCKRRLNRLLLLLLLLLLLPGKTLKWLLPALLIYQLLLQLLLRMLLLTRVLQS